MNDRYFVVIRYDNERNKRYISGLVKRKYYPSDIATENDVIKIIEVVLGENGNNSHIEIE